MLSSRSRIPRKEQRESVRSNCDSLPSSRSRDADKRHVSQPNRIQYNQKHYLSCHVVWGGRP